MRNRKHRVNESYRDAILTAALAHDGTAEFAIAQSILELARTIEQAAEALIRTSHERAIERQREAGN